MLGKKKICKECKTEELIWKFGCCKTCSFKLNNVDEKQIKKKEIKKEKTKLLHEYMYAWWSGFGENKRCMACDCLLSKEFSTANVDHLLPKSGYKDLSFSHINFFLCCIDCHSSKEMGFPKEKHKLAIEKIKKLYNL